MTKRRTLMMMTTALMALCLPFIVSAQGTYNSWGHDRDYRRDGRYDRYDYDRRALRDSVRRVKDVSKDFERHLDSALDHSRYNDSHREDRINNVAKDFHNAASDLKDRYDDGRNLNRSADAARRLLDLGAGLDRFVYRNQFDSRVMNDWARIRQDLQVIANAYGFRFGDFNNGYYRRDRDDNGYYRRYPTPRSSNNAPSWGRFPF